MFIGRDRELATLNKLYKSNKFEFTVIYGRRRVGKTALINQFIEGKNAIYFMGVESNAKQNLENFSKSIIEYNTGIETETSVSPDENGKITVLLRHGEKLAINGIPVGAEWSLKEYSDGYKIETEVTEDGVVEPAGIFTSIPRIKSSYP